MSKNSGYRKRCCLCTRHGSGLCYHHQRISRPQITPRAAEEAATVGGDVVVKQSTINGAGNGLFAKSAFNSSEFVTEFDGKHMSRHDALCLDVQTHVKAMGGNYVDGLKQPVQGRGGGSFANEKRGGANVDFEYKDTKIYLRVKKGKVIKPGEEIFIDYGRANSTSRAVAMGSAHM